jgi:hypothetical protein
MGPAGQSTFPAARDDRRIPHRNLGHHPHRRRHRGRRRRAHRRAPCAASATSTSIRAHSGLTGAIRAVTSSPMFLLGVLSMALSFFSLALHSLERRSLARRPRQRLAHLPRQRLRRQALPQGKCRPPPLARRPLRLRRRLPAREVTTHNSRHSGLSKVEGQNLCSSPSPAGCQQRTTLTLLRVGAWD